MSTIRNERPVPTAIITIRIITMIIMITMVSIRLHNSRRNDSSNNRIINNDIFVCFLGPTLIFMYILTVFHDEIMTIIIS